LLHRERSAAAPIGISERAGWGQGDLSSGVARWARWSWVRTCVGEGGGVKVERPQPEARTYDLDAGAGRRSLNVDDRVELWPAGFASGSPR
jgi:hypothetical protein